MNNEEKITPPPSILIVDDNPQNLQVLGQRLKDEDYEIEFAVNGQTALDWLDNKKFDLVLLDINMPELSGFDVIGIMRSKNELTHIPVIFLSTESARESILRGFELGGQDYVTKPFDNRELLARVRTQIALKRSLESLEELNRTLEQKVYERTVRINELNSELEEKNKKLVDLDKAKTDFLYIISHEIRTPLNGVIGILELIKDPLNKNELSGLIEMLDTSVNRLEKFSLDALLITRLKTMQDNFPTQPLRISELIENTRISFSDNLNNKNILVKVDINPELDEIKGEISLLTKALSNIMENAIYYSPDGGMIQIKTDMIDSRLTCSISDQGKGFDTGLINNISDIFHIGGERKDQSKGIGLPVAKMIMEAHGGTILLENGKTGGAVVKLIF